MDLFDSSKHIDYKGPISPCPPPLLGRRVVIAILTSGSRGLNCRSFRFSHTPALKLGSITKLLVVCSGGQFSQHWSGS